MRVLITGVAGFIGSHLASRLLAEGIEVVGIDNLSACLLENVPSGVILYREDIRSRSVYPFFRSVDSVFHLAAKNCLADCLQNPVETAEVNVAGTANILQAAREAGSKKVFYADTSAEYEGVPELPSQVERLAPLSVYARSKHAGAMFCEAYQQFHGLTVTMLRYFNVYGPAQDWRRSTPPLMSAFAMKMLRGERPVIYGTGEKRRDFIYVDDVTGFNLLALQDPRTDGKVFNVGSGTSYSVNDSFAMMAVMLETDVRPVHRDDLPGEAEATLADITNERALGW